jgi:hypothetical protein
MRIDNTMNTYYYRFPVPEEHTRFLAAQQGTQPQGGTFRPWITVDISPEALAAYAKSEATGKVAGMEKLAALTECQTCKNRKYQDSSDDPSVSFQAPTHISPGQSAALVSAHEGEHVSNEQAKADREGRKVVSQTVTLESSICPECGRIYISGGTTRTVTVKDNDNSAPA